MTSRPDLLWLLRSRVSRSSLPLRPFAVPVAVVAYDDNPAAVTAAALRRRGSSNTATPKRPTKSGARFKRLMRTAPLPSSTPLITGARGQALDPAMLVGQLIQAVRAIQKLRGGVDLEMRQVGAGRLDGMNLHVFTLFLWIGRLTH